MIGFVHAIFFLIAHITFMFLRFKNTKPLIVAVTIVAEPPSHRDTTAETNCQTINPKKTTAPAQSKTAFILFSPCQ